MPLSRLTPRSSRSALKRKSSSQGDKPGNNQKHVHLWAAIRKTRDELDHWQRQVDQVQALFALHVAPREHELTQVTCLVTGQLIDHFRDTDLDIPDRSLLGLWVTDTLDSLTDHPFGDAQRTRTLGDQWLQLLNIDGPIENQLARLARQQGFHTAPEDVDAYLSETEQTHTTTDGRESPVDLADSSASRAQSNNTTADASGSTNADSCANNRGPDDSEHASEDTAKLDQTIRTLEDKLSIERLFRQLAKVLHPDREQDENARAKKHILMSECLKARQDKDINALLTLYCDHVGDLPDDLNNNSHTELVAALEAQLKNLQAELRTRRFGDPVQSMIVERYSSANQSDCERRIQRHAESLQEEIAKACKLTTQLSSREGLLDALDERRAIEQDKMAINEMTGF